MVMVISKKRSNLGKFPPSVASPPCTRSQNLFSPTCDGSTLGLSVLFSKTGRMTLFDTGYMLLISRKICVRFLDLLNTCKSSFPRSPPRRPYLLHFYRQTRQPRKRMNCVSVSLRREAQWEGLDTPSWIWNWTTSDRSATSFS